MVMESRPETSNGKRRGRSPVKCKKIKREVEETPVSAGVSHVPRKTTRRDLANPASDEARQHAIKRAQEIQFGLGPDYPSFTKSMRRSHVSGGFWLGLPPSFCKRHMPKDKVYMTLIDEEMNTFVSHFLANSNALSGGWKRFAVDHKLADGDALVFHLVDQTTFKVYIVRADIEQPATKMEEKLHLDQDIQAPNHTTNQDEQARHDSRANTENPSVPIDHCNQDMNQARTSIDLDMERRTSMTLDAQHLPSQMVGNQDINGSVGLNVQTQYGSTVLPSMAKKPENTGNCFRCFQMKQELKRKALEAEQAIHDNEERCLRLIKRKDLEVEQAVKKNEELLFIKSCKVCMDNDVSMLLLPCRHFCLCKTCDVVLHTCPICGNAKVNSVEIFMF